MGTKPSFHISGYYTVIHSWIACWYLIHFALVTRQSKVSVPRVFASKDRNRAPGKTLLCMSTRLACLAIIDKAGIVAEAKDASEGRHVGLEWIAEQA
jgi:SNF family Na+-dependent transporter